MPKQTELRKLPSVDKLLTLPAIQTLIPDLGHDLVTTAVRHILEQARAQVLGGLFCPSLDELCADVQSQLARQTQPTLRPAINATGVVIHTNLGRAPLCTDALEAMLAVGQGYSNLEYSLEAGRRGSRYVHAEELLTQLTGAEAALVVNNNAGAVFLALSALAQGREVVISRGQLVEIGGGFRIPDVMRQSGAHLVEVGTTNRTHLHDYAQAIGPETAMLMLAHQSNFRINGFTSQVPAKDLVELAHDQQVIVYEDLGSGTLLPTEAYGFSHEPTVQEGIAAGVDLLSFSGDKLLGAPQAGILVGKKIMIERLRHFSLTRAMRVDKTTLAGLQATLLHYLKGDAETTIPTWRMLSATTEELSKRAHHWQQRLSAQDIETKVIKGHSTVGGGSLPGETLPTWLLTIRTASPDAFAARLRAGQPPVIARIENNLLCFDPRTVLANQKEVFLAAILAAHHAQP